MVQKKTKTDDKYEEKVVQVNRVSKKTKGGNKIGFSVLMVVGDRDGKVGVGLGKAPSVVDAIRKGARRAKKNFLSIPLTNDETIPHQVFVKRGAAKIIIKPAPPGTGLIAGGAVRAVAEAGGIKNMVAKILGTRNKASNVYATMEAFKKLRLTDRQKKSTKKTKSSKTKKK
jgi:small subunit ribosomal protein S5